MYLYNTAIDRFQEVSVREFQYKYYSKILEIAQK